MKIWELFKAREQGNRVYQLEYSWKQQIYCCFVFITSINCFQTDQTLNLQTPLCYRMTNDSASLHGSRGYHSHGGDTIPIASDTSGRCPVELKQIPGPGSEMLYRYHSQISRSSRNPQSSMKSDPKSSILTVYYMHCIFWYFFTLNFINFFIFNDIYCFLSNFTSNACLLQTIRNTERHKVSNNYHPSSPSPRNYHQFPISPHFNYNLSLYVTLPSFIFKDLTPISVISFKIWCH